MPNQKRGARRDHTTQGTVQAAGEAALEVAEQQPDHPVDPRPLIERAAVIDVVEPDGHPCEKGDREDSCALALGAARHGETRTRTSSA